MFLQLENAQTNVSRGKTKNTGRYYLSVEGFYPSVEGLSLSRGIKSLFRSALELKTGNTT